MGIVTFFVELDGDEFSSQFLQKILHFHTVWAIRLAAKDKTIKTQRLFMDDMLDNRDIFPWQHTHNQSLHKQPSRRDGPENNDGIARNDLFSLLHRHL